MNEQLAVRVDGTLYGEKEIKSILLESVKLRSNLASQSLFIEANSTQIASLKSQILKNRVKADIVNDLKAVLGDIMDDIIDKKISDAVRRGGYL